MSEPSNGHAFMVPGISALATTSCAWALTEPKSPWRREASSLAQDRIRKNPNHCLLAQEPRHRQVAGLLETADRAAG